MYSAHFKGMENEYICRLLYLTLQPPWTTAPLIMNTAHHQQHPIHEEVMMLHQCLVHTPRYTHCLVPKLSLYVSTMGSSNYGLPTVQIGHLQSDCRTWTQDCLKAWQTSLLQRKSPCARQVHTVACNWTTINPRTQSPSGKKAGLEFMYVTRHTRSPTWQTDFYS